MLLRTTPWWRNFATIATVFAECHCQTWGDIRRRSLLSSSRWQSASVYLLLVLLIPLFQRSAKAFYTGESGKGLLLLDRADALCTQASTLPAIDSKQQQLRLDILKVRGPMLSLSNRHSEALTCMFSRLEGVKRLYGQTSREVALCRWSISEAYYLLGQLEQATVNIEAALSMMQTLELTNDIDYSSAIDQHDLILAAQGLHERALVDFRHCLALRLKLLPPSHPYLANAHSRIASALNNLGRGPEAAAAREAATTINRRAQVACAGTGCKLRLRPDGAPLDVCVKCRCTFYCGKACQTADWKREGGPQGGMQGAH